MSSTSAPSPTGPASAPSTELHPDTSALKAAVSAQRWATIRSRADERVRILEQVRQRHAEGTSWRKALAAVAPGVGWSKFSHWRRCAARRAGAPWERQLDMRVVPRPRRIPDEVRVAACAFRRAQPTITVERSQELLVAQFGAERGKVSGTLLKRWWAAEGLSRGRGRRSSVQETTRCSGGAGLAMIAAAAAETGVGVELATSVLARGKQVVEAQAEGAASLGADARDARGCFTAQYNRVLRGTGSADPRWAPDAVKRRQRDLSTLSTPASRPEVLAHRLLCMGSVGLLSDRRGFDGLEGPRGGWQELLGGTAYMPATLDRQLSELALLDVGGALWEAHGRHWQRVTRPWWEEPSQPRWLRWACYIDATQDPYWTRRFAVSGKVSRVGRVMPCLSRVALTGGGGVPLLVETVAGSVSLKKELESFLGQAESAVGAGEIGRLTVVDAEMSTVPLLMALSARPDRWFITVLKGVVADNAVRSAQGRWQPYRAHDQLREVVVHLRGAKAPEGGLRLRAVEMVRRESRNPTSTLLVTNASAQQLSTEETATAYLSRWPNQEAVFRNTRNGIGLKRSHGYGGETVAHVALETKLERAKNRLQRAQARTAKDEAWAEAMRRGHDQAQHGQRTAARQAVARAASALTAARRTQAKAEAALERLETTPKEIYVRDTTRDGIMTCLKLTMLMLLEYVLKEYFGGARMEARTFIELLMPLPVTVHKTRSRLLYQVEANSRSPAQTDLVRAACEEINRREVRLGRRTMRFELAPPKGG